MENPAVANSLRNGWEVFVGTANPETQIAGPRVGKLAAVCYSWEVWKTVFGHFEWVIMGSLVCTRPLKSFPTFQHHHQSLQC